MNTIQTPVIECAYNEYTPGDPIALSSDHPALCVVCVADTDIEHMGE